MAYKRKFKRSRYSRKSRGRYNRKFRTRSFQSRVRRVIRKTAETKYLTGAAENLAVYHDRGAAGAGALTTNQGAIVWDPWYGITKGTGISNRIGDEIYPIGMSMRLAYWAEADRGAQYVRIIFAVLPKNWGSNVTDGTNYDLLDQAGSNDTVTGMCKREGLKVLYDRMVTLHNNPRQASDVFGGSRFFKKIWIKSKKGGKLTWGQDGLLNNKPMGIFVVPYDEYTTPRTSQLGKVAYTYKCYFKDV